MLDLDTDSKHIWNVGPCTDRRSKMQPRLINMAGSSRMALSLTPNSFTLRSHGADVQRMSMALELVGSGPTIGEVWLRNGSAESRVVLNLQLYHYHS